MKIFREKAGVISEKPVWILVHRDNMYIEHSLWKLLKTFLTEYDQHPVGY